jgi:hypothetical protein
MISAHLDVESLFDLRHLAADNQHPAIRRPIGHCKTIGLGEIGDFLVFRLCAPEPFGELGHTTPVAIVWTGWVGEPIYQASQFVLVAHGHVDDEV